jgi:ribonuclease PH
VTQVSARPDGRAAHQLRPVRLVADFVDSPLASVLAEFGRTRVLCTVSEDASVPRWMSGRGRGWITAEYSMLPGATAERTAREVASGRPSGRTQEIQRLIGRSLRAVADLSALGERTLWVDCDVLQADGGTRCASISGAWVALALAARRLQHRGALARPLLRDSVAAVSAGVVAGEVRLDLEYAEDARAAVDMNVVATGSGRFVELQGTGEESSFSREELDALTSLALAGIAEIGRIQQRVLAQADPAR